MRVICLLILPLIFSGPGAVACGSGLGAAIDPGVKSWFRLVPRGRRPVEISRSTKIDEIHGLRRTSPLWKAALYLLDRDGGGTYVIPALETSPNRVAGSPPGYLTKVRLARGPEADLIFVLERRSAGATEVLDAQVELTRSHLDPSVNLGVIAEGGPVVYLPRALPQVSSVVLSERATRLHLRWLAEDQPAIVRDWRDLEPGRVLAVNSQSEATTRHNARVGAGFRFVADPSGRVFVIGLAPGAARMMRGE